MTRLGMKYAGNATTKVEFDTRDQECEDAHPICALALGSTVTYETHDRMFSRVASWITMTVSPPPPSTPPRLSIHRVTMTVGGAPSGMPTASWFIAARAVHERSYGHCNRAEAPRGPRAIADAPAAAVRNRVAEFGPWAANARKAIGRLFGRAANARRPVVKRDVWTANARKPIAQFFEPTANSRKAVGHFCGRAASRQLGEIHGNGRFSGVDDARSRPKRL